MEKINEFISSGIIEMYCMGLTSEEETAEVIRLASIYKDVRDEIEQVSEALCAYATDLVQEPHADVKSRILESLNENEDIAELPLKLSQNASVDYWFSYLEKNKIVPPAEFDPFFLAILPSDEKQFTYAAWARKGADLEETHDDEDEWLFVLRGTCEMTVNGKISQHKAGDLIAIPRRHIHKAEATSDDMILIGQRIAA